MRIGKGILIGFPLVILAALIFIVIIESIPPQINPELNQEIKTTYTTSQYYVSEIKDDGSILRITLTLQFTPRKEIQLENIALPICMEIVNLLKKYSLKRNVSVWLQKPAQTKGFINLYGNAYYSTITGTVEWKLKN